MNRDHSNTKYYICHPDDLYLVVERTSLNHSGSHRTEEIVGEYRLESDAEAYLAMLNEGLWT